MQFFSRENWAIVKYVVWFSPASHKMSSVLRRPPEPPFPHSVPRTHNGSLLSGSPLVVLSCSGSLHRHLKVQLQRSSVCSCLKTSAFQNGRINPSSQGRIVVPGTGGTRCLLMKYLKSYKHQNDPINDRTCNGQFLLNGCFIKITSGVIVPKLLIL